MLREYILPKAMRSELWKSFPSKEKELDSIFIIGLVSVSVLR